MKTSWTKDEMFENIYQTNELTIEEYEKERYVETTLEPLINDTLNTEKYGNHITLYYIKKNLKSEEYNEEYIYIRENYSKVCYRQCITGDSKLGILIDFMKFIQKRY